jgi:PAS domain S-box-containing protein
MSYRIPMTAEKLAALQKEIEPLTAAFDLLTEHIQITDENANIIYANKAAEEQTGFSITEMIGTTSGDLWGGLMPKEFYAQMWKTIKIDKKPFVGEVKNKRKDGTEYWQEVRISPVLDENGDIKIFIGIEPNITLRKKVEAESKEKYETVEKMNKFMVGRELKMIELKAEIEKLKSQLESQ